MIGCPACGGPRDRALGGVCGYCKAVVIEGDFDWSVNDVQIVSRDLRPSVLESTVEERGTDLATVRSSTLANDLAALAAHDPAFSLEALRPRLELIFGELQVACCGAALAINQAGDCEYCKVRVTTGEFDRVLSRIEQDDSYSG